MIKAVLWITWILNLAQILWWQNTLESESLKQQLQIHQKLKISISPSSLKIKINVNKSEMIWYPLAIVFFSNICKIYYLKHLKSLRSLLLVMVYEISDINQ